MANVLSQSVASALTEPKSAVTVAAGTTLVGVGEKFKLIPWGDIAAFVGVILTVVLIITHIARYLLDRKRALLEIRKLRGELSIIDARNAERGP